MNQQILDAARNSLLRILEADTAEWSEADHRQKALEIDRLEKVIEKYEKRCASSSGRRIVQPIRRVNA